MKDQETVVRVLDILGRTPESTQRDIANTLGISLGKVNYVLKALVARGLVKTENFLNNRNKWGYRYILTPKGIREKMRITKGFVRRKMEEYERLLGEVRVEEGQGNRKS